MKPVYIGIFFDTSTYHKLEAAFGFLYPKHYAHHITIWFHSDGTPKPDLDYGREVAVTITGVVSDDKAQALTVEIPIHTKRPAHITMSTTPDTSPVYSNQLLRNQTATPVHRMKITGRLGWWDGKQPRFDSETI